MDWRGFLNRLAPNGDDEIIEGIAATADEALERWKLGTRARVSDQFGHIMVESKGLTRLDEDLNYSAKRLTEVWPNRFPTITAATPYAHNPKALALRTYGGRLGNRPHTDDGWDFRGSGLLQCTGRDNTTGLAHDLGISPEECARWLKDPAKAYLAACALYVRLGAPIWADRGNITQTTKHIQGGDEALARRKINRDKAAALLPQFGFGKVYGVAALAAIPNDDEPPPVVSGKIKAAQVRLRELGYYQVGQPDGIDGPATKSALVHFQADHDLDQTGALDDDTLDSLYRVEKRPLPESRTDATIDDLREKGSKTIERADEISTAGKIVGAGSILTVGANAADAISTASETVSKVKDATETAGSLAHQTSPLLIWASTHWLQIAGIVFVAIVGFYAWRAIKHTHEVKEERLADHTSAKNMGR